MILRGSTIVVGVVFLVVVAGFASAWADSERYQFPKIVNVTLQPKDASVPPASATEWVAEIKACVGPIKNLEIFADSSPDVQVSTATTKIPLLAEGETHRAEYAISRVDCRAVAGELGTWLRVGVRFHPDYAKLGAAVNNPASYPIAAERQRLIDAVTANEKDNAQMSEAARVFPDHPELAPR